MKQTKKLETMTVYEAARRLGCCYATTLRWTKAGTLPHVKVGRQYLILRAPFEGMLKGQPPERPAAWKKMEVKDENLFLP
jgi:excisionase family DNA binding protein